MKTTSFLIVFLLYISASNALAENSQERTLWFFSETSNLLNRSSHELATNRAQRGIRLLKKALKTNLSTGDKFIAEYNLCMAHQLEQNVPLSGFKCLQVNTLAQTKYNIKKVRGTLRLLRKNSELVME